MATWALPTAPGTPYAPPAVDEAPVASVRNPVGQHLASRGARLANHIVDSIAVTMLQFPVSYLFLGHGPDVRAAELYVVGAFFVFLGYYTLMESIWGRTVGKLVTGTRVVQLNGEPISGSQAVGRTLCRFVPFDALSFLLSQRGLHDRAARTIVVRDATVRP